MAIQYKIIGSTFTEHEGRLVERYVVWDTGATSTNIIGNILADLRAATGILPAISSNLHYRKPYASTWSASTVQSSLRLRTIDMELLECATGWAVNLTVGYGTRYVWRRDASTAKLPVQRSAQSALRQLDVYRTGTNAAPPTGLTIESATDIAGTSIDERGKPVQINIPQYQVTLAGVVDTFATPLSNYDTAASTYIDTLNSSVFMGVPAYSALLKDVTFSHLEDEYFNAKVVFVFDTFAFYNQVAEADTDGKPKLRQTDGKAATVKWKRATYGSSNWNTLFPAGWAFDRLQNGENGVTP